MKKNDLVARVALTQMAGVLLAAGESLGLKSRSRFRGDIRSGIRGLWTGHMDEGQFFIHMDTAIRSGFTRAWAEGAAKHGVAMDELTESERTRMVDLANEQATHIWNLADFIMENSKANGGKLGKVMVRADLWVQQYDRVVQEAGARAAGDKKMKWTLGPTEHCTSCLALSGRVKRASFWVERGILPRVPGATYLECRGYKCQCELKVTSDPVSRGPLPSLA